MNSRMFTAAVAVLWIAGAGAPATAQTRERMTTVADRRAVSVTIYNNNLALVRDERRVALARGSNHLAWRDVTAKIDPTTALFRSLAAPDAVTVGEQNFNYDLLNPDTVLRSYQGRDVTVVHVNPATGAQTREPARILSTEGGVVLRYRDRIETSVDGRILYPGFPSTLRDRPTLVIDAASRIDRPQELELTYLTGGLSWHADYVGSLSPSNRLQLDGLVTLANDSGTAFANARLQLIAGDVNVPAPTPAGLQQIGRVASTANVYQPFSEQAISEYHLYTLGRPTTIADKQTKQVAFLAAHDIPVTRTLEVRGGGSYRNAQADAGTRVDVANYLTFHNDGGELGIPLPAGTVRIYQRDADGSTQFVGGDRIGHTPRRETVRLRLGNAFDVTARRRQTDFTHVDTTHDRSRYEIVVRNAKPVPVRSR